MSWYDQCKDIKNRAHIWSWESCNAYEVFHLLCNCFSLAILVLLYLFCLLRLPTDIFLIPILFFLVAALVHVAKVILASRRLSKSELSDKVRVLSPDALIDADESKRQYAIVFLVVAFLETSLYLLSAEISGSLYGFFLFSLSTSCAFLMLASVYAGRYPKTSVLLIAMGQPIFLYITIGAIVPLATLILDPTTFFSEIEKCFVDSPKMLFFLLVPPLVSTLLASFLVAPYFLKSAQSFSAVVGIVMFGITVGFVGFTEFPNSVFDFVFVYNNSGISAAIGTIVQSLLASVAVFAGVATIRNKRAQNNARKALERASVYKRQNSNPIQELAALKTRYLYNGGDIMHWGVIIEEEKPES